MAANTMNITTHGIDLEIDRDCLDDYEILLLIKKLDQRQLQYVPDVIRKLLGEAQEQKVIDAMVEKHGRCRITDMNDVINDVIAKLSQADDTSKK